MKAIAAFLLLLALGFFVATFGGTIVYWLWPSLVTAFNFPPLTWGQAVALTWIAHILFNSKSTSSSESK